MGSKIDWSLPSESRWVQNLLYLAEGAAIGAGFSIVLVYLFGLGFFIYAIGYEFVACIGSIVVLGVLLVLLVRWTAFIDWITHDAPVSEGMRDWQETHEWRWVALVGALISVANIAFSLALWKVGTPSLLRDWSQMRRRVAKPDSSNPRPTNRQRLRSREARTLSS